MFRKSVFVFVLFKNIFIFAHQNINKKEMTKAELVNTISNKLGIEKMILKKVIEALCKKSEHLCITEITYI